MYFRADYQFFPKRFVELQEQDTYWTKVRFQNVDRPPPAVPLTAPRFGLQNQNNHRISKGEEPPELATEEAKEQWRIEEQRKIDDAKPLTEEERDEMEALSSEVKCLSNGV